jgi:hypothetical protein
VYKAINLSSGGTTIRARVESVEENSAADGWTKAGVMVRDSLDPDAPYVAVLLTPANGARNQFRLDSGDSTDREFDPNIVAPYWVRAEMTSTGLVRAYISQDGQDWTQFSLQVVSREARNRPLYVGMVVTSHLTGETTQAVLSNVTITGPGSDGPWINQDVGIVSNSTQPMYVSLNDTPVFYQDPNTLQTDPDATQIVDWTNWLIPLRDFADQGVDLTNVTNLGIGIGNKADTSTDGGKGTVYLDDIRLYRPQD